MHSEILQVNFCYIYTAAESLNDVILFSSKWDLIEINIPLQGTISSLSFLIEKGPRKNKIILNETCEAPEI